MGFWFTFHSLARLFLKNHIVQACCNGCFRTGSGSERATSDAAFSLSVASPFFVVGSSFAIGVSPFLGGSTVVLSLPSDIFTISTLKSFLKSVKHENPSESYAFLPLFIAISLSLLF
uniref:Uncharacterized protein n=1 Tax=Lepeophtheirus salmonis TaxID=72036 RepID=A0A0K2UPC4_LEPSM